MLKYVDVVSNWNRGQGRLTAYLYGFAVGKSTPLREHNIWLNLFASEVLSVGGANLAAKRNVVCVIWLVGTASRTAPFATTTGSLNSVPMKSAGCWMRTWPRKCLTRSRKLDSAKRSRF